MGQEHVGARKRRLPRHRHVLRRARDLGLLRSASRSRRSGRRCRSTANGLWFLGLAISLYPVIILGSPGDLTEPLLAVLRLVETLSLVWIVPYVARSIRDLRRDLRRAERRPDLRGRPLDHLIGAPGDLVGQSRRCQQQEHDGSARRDPRDSRDRGAVASPLGTCGHARRRAEWRGTRTVHRLDCQLAIVVAFFGVTSQSRRETHEGRGGSSRCRGCWCSLRSDSCSHPC